MEIKYSRQQKQIIEACISGEWVCHKTLKNLQWNEHKRRGEIRDKREYAFEGRPCEHGIPRTLDYRMRRINPVKPVEIKQQPLFV